MGIAVLLLVVASAVGPSNLAAGVSEQAFLDAASSDGRVRAVLEEPLVVARAARARAGKLSNPEAAFDREDLNGSPRQDTWTLSWAPPLDGRSGMETRAGKAALGAAEMRQELNRVAWRADVREAFAEWSLAQGGAAIGAELAALADRLARQADIQASRGESSALTARRLLLARVEIRAEAARLAAELAHARGRVRTWMPALALDAVPARPPLPPTPSDPALWSRSPRLTALGYEVEQAEASADLAGRFWALPELSIGYQTVRGELEDLGGPTFGVRWGLPLFDRRQGDRLEARGRLDATRARRELEQARVREEFAAALSAYATLRESAVLAAEAEPVAARVLASAVAIFEAGESDVTDLLETLRGVLGGHQAVLESYGAALRAHRELEVAAGRSLPLTEGDEK